MEHTLRELPNLPSWLANVITPEWWNVIFLVGQSLVIFLSVVIFFALMIPYERRMLALWQDRYGRTVWVGKARYKWRSICLKSFLKKIGHPNLRISSCLSLPLRLRCLPLWQVISLYLFRRLWVGQIGALVFCFSLQWQAWRYMR